MNKYIDKCIEEANKAYLNDEVPIGACIVYDGKILCSAHNTKNFTNDVTNHAEILCIRDASKILNNWRLIDCDLYVTLFPCPMCMSAIRQARISNVYYLVENQNDEYQKVGNTIANIKDINPTVNLIKIDSDDYRKVIKDFYSNKR